MTMISDLPVLAMRGAVSRLRRLLKLGELVPLSLVQLAGRAAVAAVFWKSAQTKLASWPVTQQLFALEYDLPVLDPNLAAALATAAEISGALMLVLGLLARLGALVLLGVTAIIQIFVFPGHWGEHLLWASVLGLIVARGAGFFSIDHLAERGFRR
jgi:putative oxidoreductase